MRLVTLRVTIAAGLALAGCAPAAVPPAAQPTAHPAGAHGGGHPLETGEVVDLTFDPRYDRGAMQRQLAAAGSDPLQEPEPAVDTDPAENKRTYTLIAREEDVQIVPNGPPTRMLVFRDAHAVNPAAPSFPGPGIIAQEGDEVTVNVINQMPNRGTEFERRVNMHFHGMIIEPEQDGSPQSLIEPTDTHTYRWIARVGFPMTGWYHAHTHGVTHIHVGNGLLGKLVILPREGLPKTGPNVNADFPPEERVTKPEPLPKAVFGDTSLFLTDMRLDENNQIGPDNEFDRINGREGNLLLVNRQIFPTLTLRRGEVRRVRIVNSSQARFYNLNIKPPEAGPAVQMIQVGTDGGLFLLPEPKDKILLSNAERVEVLLKAPDQDGEHVLQSLPFDRGQGLREDEPLPLMKIKVEGALPGAAPPIPARLRYVPNLRQIIGNNVRTRNFRVALVSVGGGRNHFTIDAKLFDPLRIDNVVQFNTPEIWNIENNQGNWAHPMHLHNIQFQILDIDGEAEPANNPKWKDTVNVPRSARARIIERFDDRRGMFFFHCHILQHESDGLMTTAFIEDNAPPFQADELPGNLGRPPEEIKR
jgi:FtsP/CotA-like multicopper oxidase with cupredoxin domain